MKRGKRREKHGLEVILILTIFGILALGNGLSGTDTRALLTEKLESRLAGFELALSEVSR